MKKEDIEGIVLMAGIFAVIMAIIWLHAIINGNV
jgi:hypothetical protein